MQPKRSDFDWRESTFLRWAIVAAAGVATAALVWGFWLLFSDHAPVVFRSAEEDMSYGWFVPVFSLYAVWRERDAYRREAGRPSWAGMLASLPFFFIGFLGVRGAQIRLEILALAGLLVTLAWAFFGRAVAKRALFPAGFLLFCMPFNTYLDVVTVHLRLFATSTAHAILQGVGADVVRRGTMLASASGAFSIDVAEPCSGLRSIFALMALTAGYAYFTQPTWLRRAALFACSVPLAILGNVARILTIAFVGTNFSADFATGFYHDYSGYVVFFVAIALMVACGAAIDAVAGRVKRGTGKMPVPREKGEGTGKMPVPRDVARAVAFALVTAAAMAWQAHVPETVLTEAPVIVPGDVAGYVQSPLDVVEAERKTLPKDTAFVKRLYTATDGTWHQVSFVIGGRSKSSVHRPELCLPSQGFLMRDPHTLSLAGHDWRILTLEARDRPPMGFAYTFYNQAGFRTASHVSRILRDVIDRSLFSRIDRWVMVTVCSSTADERINAAFLRRLKEAGGW